MCRTGRPGITVFSQSAHTCMPGSSDSTRPTRISAFLWPAATWSRAYSTDSHSRTSPATIGVDLGQQLQRRLDRRRSGQQPDAAHARLRVADDADAAAGAQVLRDRGDQGVHGQGRHVVPPRIAGHLVLRPAHRLRQADRERVGLAQPPVIAQPDDHQLVLIDERVLGGEHGIGRAAAAAASAGVAPAAGGDRREDRRLGLAAPAASARPSWRRTSAGSRSPRWRRPSPPAAARPSSPSRW